MKGKQLQRTNRFKSAFHDALVAQNEELFPDQLEPTAQPIASPRIASRIQHQEQMAALESQALFLGGTYCDRPCAARLH